MSARVTCLCGEDRYIDTFAGNEVSFLVSEKKAERIGETIRGIAVHGMLVSSPRVVVCGNCGRLMRINGDIVDFFAPEKTVDYSADE